MSLLLLLVSACKIPCTDLASSSVVVTVLDEAGAPISGADVRAAEDDAEPEACTTSAPGDYICSGGHNAHLVITASFQGFDTATAEVDVVSRQCEVRDQTVELVLQTKTCADVEPVGVDLEVVGSGVDPLVGVWATYRVDGGEAADCVAVGDAAFQCGTEVGEYVLTAGAEGREEGTATITVEEDSTGCYPETGHAKIVLD